MKLVKLLINSPFEVEVREVTRTQQMAQKLKKHEQISQMLIKRKTWG